MVTVAISHKFIVEVTQFVYIYYTLHIWFLPRTLKFGVGPRTQTNESSRSSKGEAPSAVSWRVGGSS